MSSSMSATFQPSIPRSINTTTSSLPFKQTISSRIHRLAYDNSVQVKRALIASSVGIAILMYQYLFLSTVVATLLVGAAVSYGKYNGYQPKQILGHTLTLPKTIYHFFVPPKHLMTTHVFNPVSFGSYSLKYEGDVPVLTLIGDNYHVHGFAHGSLLAPQIQKMLKAWGSILWTVIPEHTSTDAKKLCEHLKQLIPPRMITEMEGLAEGFNTRMAETSQSDRVTVNELLLFHLVPEVMHTYPTTLAKKLLPPMGCTTIIDKERIMRNLDWPTLGVAGPASIVFRRIHSNGKITHEVGFAGLIGTLTAMSNRGLALSMNVALGKTVNVSGLPATILNRMILENCESVDEALLMLNELRPIGGYHLSMLDAASNAAAVHFYQDVNQRDFVRTHEHQDPVVTTNCCYSSAGHSSDYFNSYDREYNILNVFANSKKDRRETMIDALNTPLVSNHETAQVVEMCPKTGEMRVVFGNAYAGDNPMQLVKFPV